MGWDKGRTMSTTVLDRRKGGGWRIQGGKVLRKVRSEGNRMGMEKAEENVV